MGRRFFWCALLFPDLVNIMYGKEAKNEVFSNCTQIKKMYTKRSKKHRFFLVPSGKIPIPKKGYTNVKTMLKQPKNCTHILFCQNVPPMSHPNGTFQQ